MQGHGRSVEVAQAGVGSAPVISSALSSHEAVAGCCTAIDCCVEASPELSPSAPPALGGTGSRGQGSAMQEGLGMACSPPTPWA